MKKLKNTFTRVVKVADLLRARTHVRSTNYACLLSACKNYLHYFLICLHFKRFVVEYLIVGILLLTLLLPALINFLF